MAIEIGVLPEERLADWLACDAAAFGGTTEPDELAQFREVLDFDRCQMAVDEGEVVSTACVFPFEMTVPGAVTPMAGVSFVSVKPTHRRKGVLTAMMRRQLEDVRERGESMASLWASESVIYGRFGYGMSSESVEWEIERARTRPAVFAWSAKRMRFVIGRRSSIAFDRANRGCSAAMRRTGGGIAFATAGRSLASGCSTR
jgi:predicted acetyltransferase